jgi:hypothetical protein
MDKLSRLMNAIRERHYSDTHQAAWGERERSALKALGYPERDFERLLSLANEQHQRSVETFDWWWWQIKKRVLRGVPTNQIIRELRALAEDQSAPGMLGW